MHTLPETTVIQTPTQKLPMKTSTAKQYDIWLHSEAKREILNQIVKIPQYNITQTLKF